MNDFPQGLPDRGLERIPKLDMYFGSLYNTVEHDQDHPVFRVDEILGVLSPGGAWNLKAAVAARSHLSVWREALVLWKAQQH